MSSTATNGIETKTKSEVRGYHGNYKNVGGLEPDVVVDLRSDTVTRPSNRMREFMINAEVGDDVMGEDPTVTELENRMAKELGKEAGLFITSGSMGNLMSVLVHCTMRGAETIVGSNSHMFLYEQGSMAQFGGVQANPIQNEPDGTYSIVQLVKSIRPDDIHYAKTSLICVENTHNMCGGRVVPLKWLDEVAEVARKHGIPTHMDGARLFNAAIASDTPASRIVRDFDSVSVCLSKSLGAPVGSVLVGSQKFIDQARRIRKALGGGMRQTGIIAAAGIYCLDHMIDRLHMDHTHAKVIAGVVHKIQSPLVTTSIHSVDTNIVLLQLNGIAADGLCARFATVTEGEKESLGLAIQVLCSPKSDDVIRLVTHCDVSIDMAVQAADKINYVIKELSAQKQTSA